MAKLTLWMAVQNSDSQCYNIIAKTKKECQAKVDAHWNSKEFETPVKVTIEYKDAFDLFELATGEAGGRSVYY